MTRSPLDDRLLSFDSLYGWAYDSAINLRPLAIAELALQWGADGRRLFRMMAEGAACAPGETVLDCPTGGGTAFAVAGPRVRGRLLALDLSRGMLSRAAARRGRLGLEARVALVRADAARLPLADGAVDRALCFLSLHCIREQEPVLRELHRVLRPGGRLVAATLCADPPPPWRLAVALTRARFPAFTPPRVRDLARWGAQAGFDWRQERTGAMLYVSAVRMGGH